MKTKAKSGREPILVIRFSSLGDVLLTEPALRALRKSFPDSPIHYLTKTHYTDIITGFEAVDRIIPYDRSTGLIGLLRTALRLRKDSYLLIADLHGSMRSFLVRHVVAADTVTKIRKNTLRRHLLIRFGRGKGELWPTAVERYLACVPGDHGFSSTTRPTLSIDDDTKMAAARVLGEPLGEGHLLALAPGARWQTKMWPWERYAELGSRLSSQTGYGAVVLGSREDSQLCDRVARRIGGRARSIAGRTTLLEAGAVLSMCSLLITNDSGLMHLADAVGTPVLAVFGPTSRELGFFPDEDSSRVMEVELPCRPCTTKGNRKCPEGTHDCMDKITVEAAMDAALKILNSRRTVEA